MFKDHLWKWICFDFDKIDFPITKTAYGIGNRDSDVPNVLRVFLCEGNETQKDIETLRLQLDSYDGSIENIDKLNATVIDYKDKILTLQRQKEAYDGDQNSLDNLTKQFNTYKDQLESLQKQMLAFQQVFPSSLVCSEGHEHTHNTASWQ